MNQMLRGALAVFSAVTLLAGVACSSLDASDLKVTQEQGSSGNASAPGGSQPTPASQPPVSGGTVVPAPSSTSTSSRGMQPLTTQDVVRLAEPAIVRIQTQSGVGTGFIVDDEGYIITNKHVVTGPTNRVFPTVEVTLSDGAKKTAKVVGSDVRSDLALVKLDGGGFKSLKLGKLDDVAVGQDVVAIGYALDLTRGEGPSYSVTRGIVSAKNRGIDEGATILGAIQTDAAINHGNSGGPLLDLFGQVIGVNTAIAPDKVTGGIAAGIGFAVGVDTVSAVYEQLRANGSVNRGLLGITNFEALRPARAQDLGLAATQGGVLLGANSVAAGGPAAKGGLRTGDVITRIGQLPLRNESDLAVALIRNGGGKPVEIEFYRSGAKQTAMVMLDTAPE